VTVSAAGDTITPDVKAAESGVHCAQPAELIPPMRVKISSDFFMFWEIV
jgi:hypothetical protein